jgi:hypothetical protein
MSAYTDMLKRKFKPTFDLVRELKLVENPSDEQKAALVQGIADLEGFKAEHERALDIDQKASSAEDWYTGLDDPTAAPRGRVDRPSDPMTGGRAEVKALSSYLLDHPDFRNPRGGAYNTVASAPIGALYPYVERKTAYIPGNLNLASGNVQVFGPNTPRVPHPFLELLRTIPYNDLAVPYLAPVFTNNAAEVDIGANKVESTNTGDIATVMMRTIAHWKDVPRQILRAFPTMRSIIDDELIGGVLSKAEDSILNGTGTGTAMRGILAWPGIDAAVGADMVTQILNALGVIGARGGAADAILMNPSDYYALIAAAYDDNKFTPIVSGGRVAGVPVVLEGSLAAGTSIVGDWSRAVALYVAETASVRAAEIFTPTPNNVVRILAEMDCVVLVERPNLLVTTDAPIVAP